MGKVKCCINGCNNNTKNRKVGNDTLRFHRFPFKRPDVLKQWIQALGRKPTIETVICSQHFNRDDYNPPRPGAIRWRLKAHAVPSIFKLLPDETEEISNEETVPCNESNILSELETPSDVPILNKESGNQMTSEQNVCQNNEMLKFQKLRVLIRKMTIDDTKYITEPKVKLDSLRESEFHSEEVGCGVSDVDELTPVAVRKEKENLNKDSIKESKEGISVEVKRVIKAKEKQPKMDDTKSSITNEISNKHEAKPEIVNKESMHEIQQEIRADDEREIESKEQVLVCYKTPSTAIDISNKFTTPKITPNQQSPLVHIMTIKGSDPCSVHHILKELKTPCKSQILNEVSVKQVQSHAAPKDRKVIKPRQELPLLLHCVVITKPSTETKTLIEENVNEMQSKLNAEDKGVAKPKGKRPVRKILSDETTSCSESHIANIPGTVINETTPSLELKISNTLETPSKSEERIIEDEFFSFLHTMMGQTTPITEVPNEPLILNEEIQSEITVGDNKEESKRFTESQILNGLETPGVSPIKNSGLSQKYKKIRRAGTKRQMSVRKKMFNATTFLNKSQMLHTVKTSLALPISKVANVRKTQMKIDVDVKKEQNNNAEPEILSEFETSPEIVNKESVKEIQPEISVDHEQVIKPIEKRSDILRKQFDVNKSSEPPVFNEEGTKEVQSGISVMDKKDHSNVSTEALISSGPETLNEPESVKEIQQETRVDYVQVIKPTGKRGRKKKIITTEPYAKSQIFNEENGNEIQSEISGGEEKEIKLKATQPRRISKRILNAIKPSKLQVSNAIASLLEPPILKKKIFNEVTQPKEKSAFALDKTTRSHSLSKLLNLNELQPEISVEDKKVLQPNETDDKSGMNAPSKSRIFNALQSQSETQVLNAENINQIPNIKNTTKFPKKNEVLNALETRSEHQTLSIQQEIIADHKEVMNPSVKRPVRACRNIFKKTQPYIKSIISNEPELPREPENLNKENVNEIVEDKQITEPKVKQFSKLRKQAFDETRLNTELAILHEEIVKQLQAEIKVTDKKVLQSKEESTESKSESPIIKGVETTNETKCLNQEVQTKTTEENKNMIILKEKASVLGAKIEQTKSEIIGKLESPIKSQIYNEAKVKEIQSETSVKDKDEVRLWGNNRYVIPQNLNDPKHPILTSISNQENIKQDQSEISVNEKEVVSPNVKQVTLVSKGEETKSCTQISNLVLETLSLSHTSNQGSVKVIEPDINVEDKEVAIEDTKSSTESQISNKPDFGVEDSKVINGNKETSMHKRQIDETMSCADSPVSNKCRLLNDWSVVKIQPHEEVIRPQKDEVASVPENLNPGSVNEIQSEISAEDKKVINQYISAHNMLIEQITASTAPPIVNESVLNAGSEEFQSEISASDKEVTIPEPKLATKHVQTDSEPTSPTTTHLRKKVKMLLERLRRKDIKIESMQQTVTVLTQLHFQPAVKDLIKKTQLLQKQLRRKNAKIATMEQLVTNLKTKVKVQKDARVLRKKIIALQGQLQRKTLKIKTMKELMNQPVILQVV